MIASRDEKLARALGETTSGTLGSAAALGMHVLINFIYFYAREQGIFRGECQHHWLTAHQT